MTDQHRVTEVRDLAIQAHDPTPLSADVLYGGALPPGWSFQTLDLSEFLDRPDRKTGTHYTSTVEDLVRYAQRHGGANTEVWVGPSRVEAVLNPHEADAPGWQDHRGVAALTQTAEWQHWKRLDGHMATQEQFANHIEQGLTDIVDPEPTLMLEVAQSLTGSHNAEWRAGHRLQSGAVQFQYSEEVQARAGSTGTLDIPGTFSIGVPVFEGEDAYRVKARFRFRVSGGKLTLGYVLDRPLIVERTAVANIAERLRKTFEHVYLGSPAS